MRYRLAVFAALISVLAVTPATAQLSTKQRTDFINDCLSTCRKNPRVPEAQRPGCDTYCVCVANEADKLFNEAQYNQISSDFAAGRQTADIKRFQELPPACNRKAFSPR